MFRQRLPDVLQQGNDGVEVKDFPNVNRGTDGLWPLAVNVEHAGRLDAGLRLQITGRGEWHILEIDARNET